MAIKKDKKDIFGRERIEIDFSSIDAKYCFFLGRVNYAKAHQPLDSHIHEDMIEIVLIAKGKQVYIVDGLEYTVCSGDVFITFENELHSTGNHPEDKSLLYYIKIDLNKIMHGIVSSDNEESEAITLQLRNIGRRVFRVNQNLKSILDKLILEYYSNCRYKKTIIRNLISDFLINIIDCEGRNEQSGELKMKGVLSYIQSNIYEDITVESLAEKADLSISRFKMNFRKHIGLPPHEYVLRQKIEVAKNLLQTTEMSVTDLAFRLSFTSSQYFSTVFKRFTLMSPVQFRQHKKT